jgi:hypothetical protein
VVAFLCGPGLGLVAARRDLEVCAGRCCVRSQWTLWFASSVVFAVPRATLTTRALKVKLHGRPYYSEPVTPWTPCYGVPFLMISLSLSLSLLGRAGTRRPWRKRLQKRPLRRKASNRRLLTQYNTLKCQGVSSMMAAVQRTPFKGAGVAGVDVNDR